MLSNLFSILPFQRNRKKENACDGWAHLAPGELPPPFARDPGDDLPPMICRAVFEEMSIHANGDIVCSCADPTGLRVYGNVYRDRIADIYNGPMYQAIREWQLNSKPDCWCPVNQANCAGRISRAGAAETTTERHVKMLQLEPVSYCNLRCPSCPVTTHFPAPKLEERRDQMLPLAVMLDVIDQLPRLETLLFYNFGEAFLHRDAVAFLREVRKRRPDIYIANSTNGLPLTQSTIEAVATEALLDRWVFAIDGSSEETYRLYRSGGSFVKALRNLTATAECSSQANTRGRVEIIWQYILFEWNDSDEEIARAKQLANEIGVPINWILTHTPGASKRYLPGSAAFDSLTGDRRTYASSTCEVQLTEFIANGRIAGGRYLARISCGRSEVSALGGTVVGLEVTVENLSPTEWKTEGPARCGIGAQLRSAAGKLIRELPGCELPLAAAVPRGRSTVTLEFELPTEPGEYQIVVDVVESGVCWFYQRGSQPLILPVTIVPEPRYRSRISIVSSSITADAGAGLMIDLTVENLATTAWSKEFPDAFYIGVLLRNADGEKICELAGCSLPLSCVEPGGIGAATVAVDLPADPGEYEILVDVVENGVCWFFERGSEPLIVPLTIAAEDLSQFSDGVPHPVRLSV